MKLKQILDQIDILDIQGSFDGENEVKDIIYDSRKAYGDILFVCIVGFQSDGHVFSKNAYERGSRIFVAQKKLELPSDATVIYVQDTRKFLALSSANLYSHPAKEMLTIAITGTKGKTSTSFMIKSIFEAAGKKVGIIGTTGIYYGDTSLYLGMSTPESYELHRNFRGMVESGCDVMVMEASSQGFLLDRTYGITFDAGVFTNLSPDHIGASEHKDFDDYKRCKKMIFKQSKHGFANSDSEHFKEIISDADCPITTFSLENESEFRAVDPLFTSGDNCLLTEFTCVEKTADGEIRNTIDLNTPGHFSLYNAMAAIAVARKSGIGYDAIKEGLKTTFVKGRMELVPTDKGYTVIIDYAHNELSVENLFETIKLYNPKRIISVFGCGGNRSKLRRYSMGELIGKNSDLSVITSDNPRYEKVEDIITDILVGMDKTSNTHVIINDRKTAIEYALDNAKKGDVILLIGKGHEHYEEIEGVKYPFCERQIVIDHLKNS